MIVTYTNQYTESIRSNYEREQNALPTDVAEMKAIIGLLYIAGMHKAGRKSLQDLWDCNGFGIKIFRLTTSEYGFRFLLQTLRFDDRQIRNEHRDVGRLAPIRDLLEKFVKNCQTCYVVGENVTIDEKL
jgi:hypothetical protein